MTAPKLIDVLGNLYGEFSITDNRHYPADAIRAAVGNPDAPIVLLQDGTLVVAERDIDKRCSIPLHDDWPHDDPRHVGCDPLYRIPNTEDGEPT